MKTVCLQIQSIIDNSHESHYDSLLLHCKTGVEHKFFPEIDFENPDIVAFVEAYIALKRNPTAMEVSNASN